MSLSMTASKGSVHFALSYSRAVVRAFVANAAATSASRHIRPFAGVASTQMATVAVASSTSSSRLLTATCGFPKDLCFGPSNVLRRDGYGDDACFIARNEIADVVGVADGVGGWRNYGVDPSRVSRGLMQICAQLVKEGKFEPHLPAKLIAASYRLLYDAERKRRQEAKALPLVLGRGKKVKQPLAGSTTACVVALDRRSGRIYTANLGDSGFMVLRKGKVVHRSHEQQHYFNAPFQLTLPLDDMGKEGFLSDSPECAETTCFPVMTGDLILVATDGLFDNMPTSLIESQLGKFDCRDDSSSLLSSYDDEQRQAQNQVTIQSICNSLALQARQLANDCNHMSPFARKALEHGIQDAIGGKPDDITLILALVTEDGLEPVVENISTSSEPTAAPVDRLH